MEGKIMTHSISTPSSAAAMFFAALPTEQREERVYVLPLDAAGKVLAKPILFSVGHEDGTAQIDAGAVFREALKAGAEEIVVAHNHPSGDLTPSKADIAATKHLREAGELLSVPLVDHLILGKDGALGMRRETLDEQGCETLDAPHVSRLASKTARVSRLTSHAPTPATFDGQRA